MFTNDYTDILRDSKLLKKLLKEEKIDFKLMACQEITSRLYRFSSMHEAQQMLGVKDSVGWKIEIPAFKISIADIKKQLHKNTTDSMWRGRAYLLVEAVINCFYRGLTHINPVEFYASFDLDNLIAHAKDPGIASYLHDIPGIRLELNKKELSSESRRQHLELQTNVFNILKPYLYFESSSIPDNTYVYGLPGSGRFMWNAILTLNWMYYNPGGKVIMFGTGTSIKPFFEYLSNTYCQLKYKYVMQSTHDSYTVHNFKKFVSKYDVIYVDFFQNINDTSNINDWFIELNNISYEQKVLCLFDERQRYPYLDVGIVNKDINYIVSSQHSLDVDMEMLNKIPDLKQLECTSCPVDNRLLFALNGSAEDIMLKNILIEQIGYLNALTLLTTKAKFVGVKSVLTARSDRDIVIQIQDIAERLLSS